MKLQLQHRLPCDPETYWECLLDAQYDRELFCGVLGFLRHEVVVQQEFGDVIQRWVLASPSTAGVPRIMHHALPYEETGRVSVKDSYYVFRTVHPGARSVTVRGLMQVRNLFDVRPASIRTTELEIEVGGLPFISGLIESRIAEDMRKGYDASAKFTGEWLARKARRPDDGECRCRKCHRVRPGYVYDPTCPRGGYCEWSP